MKAARFSWRLASLLFLGACFTAHEKPPQLLESDYPGLLRPSSTLDQEVLWRQRVTARWGEKQSRSFEAAIQNRGDTLTLIGLSPLGTTGFVILYRDGKIEFENHSQEELPFPPRFMLLDVQRAFFPWLTEAGLTAVDGKHVDMVDGERVTETWQGGRLVERRFMRMDDLPPGLITIRYTWGNVDWSVPTRAELDNGWFGYRLTIDTLDETPLPSSPVSSG